MISSPNNPTIDILTSVPKNIKHPLEVSAFVEADPPEGGGGF